MRQTVLFPEPFSKPLHVLFDEPAATSDGGAILLGQLDAGLRLTERLADSIWDDRQPGKVQHTTHDLLRQRVFGIACGYEDCNDTARVGEDRVFRTLLGRSPEGENNLPSQPTLSRFENGVSASDCLRMAGALAESVFERHRNRLGTRKVTKITIDLDGSVDPTHGRQQLCLFSGYYDTWCYFPLFGFVSFNGELEQYLFASILRPGASPESVGSLPLLRRTIPRLRELFPRAKILVRLDGGFKGPQLLELLDELKVKYVIGLTGNSVLKELSGRILRETKRQSKDTEETVTLYGETRYAAKSWKGKLRRVVCKSQIVRFPGLDPRENRRYLVTNLTHRKDRVFDAYAKRGDAENRIKELKNGLHIDRTSCSEFLPNQFRVLLTAAAYVLFQQLRLHAKGTKLADAQVSTLRDSLIKIGGIIRGSVRRIVFHLSESYVWKDAWLAIAKSCGATSSA